MHNTIGRGGVSKNRQEFIASALHAPGALRLASIPGGFFSISLVGGIIAHPADSSE